MYNIILTPHRNPICLQTTVAASLSQKSSHTVPHVTLSFEISTRPLDFDKVWPTFNLINNPKIGLKMHNYLCWLNTEN